MGSGKSSFLIQYSGPARRYSKFISYLWAKCLLYFSCLPFGWHHWLDGHESEWTPGVGDGQGGLACCDSWGRKESDTTEWLIWSDLILLSENQFLNTSVLSFLLDGEVFLYLRFLLLGMRREIKLLQSCPTLCDPCSPPGSSVHGILQVRILECVAMPSSRGSSQARDQSLGLLLCLLHWQAGSLLLVPPGKPLTSPGDP